MKVQKVLPKIDDEAEILHMAKAHNGIVTSTRVKPKILTYMEILL